VTDVGLPGGMNGRQMADAGRESRPDLKVLFITGYAENAAVGNGQLGPGMAVLTKPFPIEAMATRIRSMIEAGKKRSGLALRKSCHSAEAQTHGASESRNGTDGPPDSSSPSPRGCVATQQNQREGVGMKKLVLAAALVLAATARKRNTLARDLTRAAIQCRATRRRAALMCSRISKPIRIARRRIITAPVATSIRTPAQSGRATHSTKYETNGRYLRPRPYSARRLLQTRNRRCLGAVSCYADRAAISGWSL
jgi:CheY-like chemotaxis protein